MEEEIRNGLWHCYPYRKGGRALCIGHNCKIIADIMKNNGLDTIIALSDEEPINGLFDYIIYVDGLEIVENPVKVIRSLYDRLSDNGILLFPMKNRLGIRYFCGDRDPYTKHVFDGIDRYYHRNTDKDGEYIGRMYSKSEMKSILNAAGVTDYNFFSIFSGLEYPTRIASEDYIPNEDLTNRIFPTYHDPMTVFLEEERLYSSLEQNGLLHSLANAYLVECAKNKNDMADIRYVTCSLERGVNDAMLTTLYKDGSVLKAAVFPEGEASIVRLVKNSERLNKRGIRTVGMDKDGRGVRMQYINHVTAHKHLHGLLKKDKNEFIRAFDMFIAEIVQSSTIIRNDEEYGPIAEFAYVDMVPLNSFMIEGEYVFFDQEWCFPEYPINVVKARALFSFFAYHDDCQNIEESMFDRYGLKEKKELYRKMEIDFLKEIWSGDQLDDYRRRIRRNSAITMRNRMLIDKSIGYKSIYENIFDDISQRELYVFGSGDYAKCFIDTYGTIYQIQKILDNNPLRWGGTIKGIKIENPEILKKINEATCKVFICVKYPEGIMEQLNGLGIYNYSVFDKNKRNWYRLNIGLEQANSFNKPYHIGYVAGAFDMFHIGHLNLLRRAKDRCDYLIAGVMSDERMYDLKKKYPIIPCNERMQVVAGCRYVDQVEELPADRAGIMDAYNMFHFDCMFSGDDHAEDAGWLAERERLRKHGSDIVFVSYTKETSSSEIRQKMKDDAEKVLPGDSRLLTDKNHRWIYTYDYAPDSVWEEWRSAVYASDGDKESGDSPVPSWIAQEADAVAGRFHCAGDTGREGIPAYVLLSDSHFAYNGTWDDTVASMKAISERFRLDSIIHLGDLTDGLLPIAKTKEIEDRVMSDMRSLGVPVHVMPGNHDYNYFRNNPDIRYPENSRYFIDDEKHKLRLIFIDSFDPKEEVRYGFSGECASWLDGALSSMSEGYRSIMFSHVPPLVRLQTWTKDIRNRAKLIEVLDRHADRIMALISGHSHCDLLFNELHNGKFPIVLINCAKCEYFLEHKPEGAVVPFRRLGDRTQESFDIMQVDTANNEIYFTRFGAGSDRIVRDHKAEWA